MFSKILEMKIVSNIIEDNDNKKEKLENKDEETNIEENLEVSISEMDLVNSAIKKLL